MKRGAQPPLSAEGRQALDHYAYTLLQVEDLSAITIRNCLSDLHQFIAWCERSWHDAQEDHPFTPQFIAPPLLIRYRAYLQTRLWLKPATVNRVLMSLKRSYVWATKARFIRSDPTSALKFVPKEVPAPRHLSDEEENALVATDNATVAQRDQTTITLLLHIGLRAQEGYTLTRQQVHLGKRNGMMHIIGKWKKVRDVPLNATARSVLGKYLATLPQECQYLFPSEKTQRALTGRALGHLITKYALQAQVADVSPHDLRHRFGYRMAEVVPLHRLAQIMGHDSLDTTMLSIRGTKRDLQHDVEKIAWEWKEQLCCMSTRLRLLVLGIICIVIAGGTVIGIQGVLNRVVSMLGTIVQHQRRCERSNHFDKWRARISLLGPNPAFWSLLLSIELFRFLL